MASECVCVYADSSKLSHCPLTFTRDGIHDVCCCCASHAICKLSSIRNESGIDEQAFLLCGDAEVRHGVYIPEIQRAITETHNKLLRVGREVQTRRVIGHQCPTSALFTLGECSLPVGSEVQ